jgi:large subunit ribosomal protein L18
MSDIKDRSARRHMRHQRVRKKVRGTAEVPRLVVFKSSRNLFAQVVNDDQSVTVTGASTLSPEIKDSVKGLPKMKQAEQLAKLICTRLQEKSIGKVVFDRNGYPYHGVVKTLADGVREASLLP